VAGYGSVSAEAEMTHAATSLLREARKEPGLAVRGRDGRVWFGFGGVKTEPARLWWWSVTGSVIGRAAQHANWAHVSIPRASNHVCLRLRPGHDPMA